MYDYEEPPNFYYSPEKSGFEIIGSVDVAGSYEFDILLVLKDKSGFLFWCTDSGCSCPIPFESVTIDDLHPITRENLKEFETIAQKHKPYVFSWDRNISDQITWHDDSLALFNKVFELV